MRRFWMPPVALLGLLSLLLGCAKAPDKPQTVTQDVAQLASPDSAEYQIRASLLNFYSYLLKKDADVPYHLPAVEIVHDTERVKRYSYGTSDTYIRDVHYNGDKFDHIELKDLSIMPYGEEARASYKIVPYQRVATKVGDETRQVLKPVQVNKKPLELVPPCSPVRLKKLPAEEGDETMWKVNYRDAIITGSAVPE